VTSPVLCSVIICAHNPRFDYLVRVVDALRRQTLSVADWELIAVDNASDKVAQFNLSWHPQAKTVREDKLGLAAARGRGIQETCGKVIVFIDDDNVLDAEYLKRALRIGREYPWLGIWGGQLIPEFEGPPLVNPIYYRYYLAIREFEGNRWSNNPDDFTTMPIGAAMCVRREIADEYANRLATDPRRLRLGRNGSKLLSGEDLDIAAMACEMGFGQGLFAELRLLHLIPKERMTRDFLIRVQAGNAYSQVVFRALKGQPYTSRSWISSVVNLLKGLREDSVPRAVRFARARAERRAIQDVKRWGWIS
jgi:glycosyltransferase involved in cell wall biosynthesis